MISHDHDQFSALYILQNYASGEKEARSRATTDSGVFTSTCTSQLDLQCSRDKNSMGSLSALKTLASSAQLHSHLANRPPFLLLSVELSGSLESDFVSAAKVRLSNWVRSTDRPRDLRGSSSSGPRGFHLVPACSMVGANLNEKKKKYTKSTLPSKICVVCNKPMTW